jgi:hypothetical protein
VAAGLTITWWAGRRELITMAVLELLSGSGWRPRWWWAGRSGLIAGGVLAVL